MTRRYAQAWYQAMRDAKLNAVRLHAQPYPSFYLDVADEMGILVLDETAMWASDGGPKLNDPLYWADSKQHLRELILRDRNHPSVFGWSVSNEIMPIVRGVMHNPPGMKDTLVKYYGEWAGICRQLDPTRQWISADGEDDGEGHLPVYIVHYGGTDAMDRAQKNGKPWGVGEAGNAYYGTPGQVAETNGDRAYESFLGRMEGVAASSYQSLMAQKQRHAIYQSVFNMVWYGLQPLPLGMKDTTKPPSPDDGVFFTRFQEGEPGVQPERLGPYCTTLNPGYDPSLPLYKTWPLFTAIRDAATDTVIVQRWKSVEKNKMEPAAGFFSPSTSGGRGEVRLLAGPESQLAAALKRTGVLFSDNTGQTPSILFIDGAAPPAKESRTVIDKTLAAGGTVIVWGASAAQLPALNRLLPAPLQVTQRAASSLLVAAHDDITKGLTNAGLYLSEQRPPEFIMQGLAGPLVAQSTVLLKAPETDWLKWNKQPEYAKTAMVIRSEREAKPSGIALIAKKAGAGRLLVTTLPAAPRLPKAEKAVRQLLANLGVPLDAGSDVGKPLRKTGEIIRALYAGSFPITSPQEALSQNYIDPASGEAIKSGNTVQGKTWQPFFEESGQLNLVKLPLAGSKSNGVAYLSFWVSCPRDLADLLQEPNIPVVDLEITTDEAAQVWLNGKSIINSGNKGGTQKAEALKLHRGWNHLLIKLVQTNGEWRFAGRFTCNQPDFLAGLESALEKP
jgi:beta-galactosidase